MEREREQRLKGRKGEAIQPQATYIHQPGGGVSHDHFQHPASCLLVKDAEVSHRCNGCEDDVSPLRFEVFSKCLWEEGRERRCATLSALMVLLSWAARAALARDARQCWQRCPQEGWQQGLQSLHGGR